MKKFSKTKPKAIKELASEFEVELKKSMPITVQADGSAVYKNYAVKRNKDGDWCVINVHNKIQLEKYFLKSCALLAAKEYDRDNLTSFVEIKRLDNKYKSNYYEQLVYEKNIKTAKDTERYIILLNKLENAQQQVSYLKEEISKKFAWGFA